MELFPSEATEQAIDRLGKFSEADKTWLKSLDNEERFAGIAFLQWKTAEFKRWDKLSRPSLWIEGFLLGFAMGHDKGHE